MNFTIVTIALDQDEVAELRRWRKGLGGRVQFLRSVCDKVSDELPPEPLKAGDKVKHRGYRHAVGTVIAVHKDRAWVELPDPCEYVIAKLEDMVRV